MGNDHPGPNKKSGGVFISNALIRNIAVGILGIILIVLTITYFSSGLTHKKAANEFIKYWESKNEEKLERVKILGIKKLKSDSYWVKIEYVYIYEKLILPLLPDGNKDYSWTFSGSGAFTKQEFAKLKGGRIEREELEDNEDYIFNKWDTGWFIEVKKK